MHSKHIVFGRHQSTIDMIRVDCWCHYVYIWGYVRYTAWNRRTRMFCFSLHHTSPVGVYFNRSFLVVDGWLALWWVCCFSVFVCLIRMIPNVRLVREYMNLCILIVVRAWESSLLFIFMDDKVCFLYGNDHSSRTTCDRTWLAYLFTPQLHKKGNDCLILFGKKALFNSSIILKYQLRTFPI